MVEASSSVVAGAFHRNDDNITQPANAVAASRFATSTPEFVLSNVFMYVVWMFTTYSLNSCCCLPACLPYSERTSCSASAADWDGAVDSFDVHNLVVYYLILAWSDLAWMDWTKWGTQ